MNKKISPQENFYLYANGQWILENPIPKDYSRWSIFEKVDQDVEQRLIHILNALASDTSALSKKINQQLNWFYQSGLNVKDIEAKKEAALRPYLKAIDDLNSPQDLKHILIQLRAIGLDPFFSFSDFNDFHQKDMVIANINQDGLNMPDRSYYLETDAQHLAIQAHYQTLLQHYFKLIGETDQQAKISSQDAWEIEKQLAIFSEEHKYFRVPSHIDNPSTAILIDKNYPHLDFASFVAELGFKPDLKINVSTPAYFEKLNTYITQLDIQKIKHYLKALMIYNYASYLNDDYRQAKCSFYKLLQGIQSCTPRQRLVVKTIDSALPFALGDLYVQNYAHGEEKTMLNTIIQDIRAVLRQRILEAQWMSDKTKAKALLKLDKMRSRVGYPEKSLDYSNLNVKQQSFAANVMAASQFNIQRHDKKINHPINPTEWEMAPQTVNAYYDISKNEINIPLGILQMPFFDTQAPKSINYSGIGTVIGHEISHGFDDEGAQFDENGQRHFWWSPEEWQIYQKKTNCIIEQFSKYSVGEQKLKVNGKLVSGEAIADTTGLDLAFRALGKASNHSLTALDKQTFFINFAHLWASNDRPQDILLRIHTDPHPPMMYRVNGSLENNLNFYQSFEIKPKKKADDICHIF